jgi:hypothetical protein
MCLQDVVRVRDGTVSELGVVSGCFEKVLHVCLLAQRAGRGRDQAECSA